VSSRFEDLLEEAADWADRRGVDYSIFRDGGDWTIQIRLSDTNGTFLEFFTLPEPGKVGSLSRRLDMLCAAARKKRINGGKPAYQRA